MSRKRAWAYGAAGVAFAWLLWWTFDRNAGAPVRDLRAQLGEKREELERRMESIHGARGADRELKAIAARSVGATPEEAVHALRVALNTIAREGGLSDISVDSRDAGPVRSPAERSRSFREADGREKPDFHVIEGSLRGTASLDDAMRVLARVQSQAWPKQVVSASLSPREDGRRVELSIALRTAFLDGFAAGDETLSDANPELLARGEAVARGQVFTAWTPSAVAQAPAVPDPPTARGPAWDDWSITGVVDGRDGEALMLINRKSREQKTLRRGEALLGLVFEGTRDGAALIRSEEGTFALLPGESLAARDRPVTDL